MNFLIKGDNIDVLKYLAEERGFAGKIDLIYTDPRLPRIVVLL